MSASFWLSLLQSRNDVHLLHIHATAKEVGGYKDPLFEGLTSIVRSRMVLVGGFLKGLTKPHTNQLHDSHFIALNFQHHTFWTHHHARLLPWTLAGVRFARIPRWYYHPSWPVARVVWANVSGIVRGVLPVFLVFDDSFFCKWIQNLCVSSLFYFGPKLFLCKWGDHWWRRSGFVSLLANGAKRDHPDPIWFSETSRCLVCKGLGQWM